MSAAIEVYRGDGMRRGRDIVEPILSDTALIHRGVAEMDENAHQANSIQAEVVYRDGVRLGQLVEMLDISTSTVFRAKITGISINMSLGDATMVLTLQRPV